MSRLILAVDTTHEYGSLALVRGCDVVEETLLHSPSGFAHVLYPELQNLFLRCGLKLADVDCFAAASGPGSFTGVRVGLACIKGLAEACGKPAAAVSNLRALAAFGTGPLRAVVLDARRGEVYGALYDASGRPVAPEVVTPFQHWLDALPSGGIEFIYSDFAPPLEGTRFASATVIQAPRALAAAVARLAPESDPGDPALLDANYVRRSDAELFWKD